MLLFKEKILLSVSVTGIALLSVLLFVSHHIVIEVEILISLWLLFLISILGNAFLILDSLRNRMTNEEFEYYRVQIAAAFVILGSVGALIFVYNVAVIIFYTIPTLIVGVLSFASAMSLAITGYLVADNLNYETSSG